MKQLFIYIFLLCSINLFAQTRDYTVLEHTPTDIIGEDFSNIVGFTFDGVSWQHIPIAFIEYKVIEAYAPYGIGQQAGTFLEPDCFNQFNTSRGALVTYPCDTKTFIGADTDSNFDLNDKLYFMWSDLQDGESATLPANTIELKGKVRVNNPDGGNDRFLYLFTSNTLTQDAGVSRVSSSYTFDVINQAGATPMDTRITESNVPFSDYLTKYDRCQFGLDYDHPQNFVVTTDHYEIRSPERTVFNYLSISETGNGVYESDILDFFMSNNQSDVRHPYNYAEARGAVVAYHETPFFVLYDVIGTNSGSTNELRVFFYPEYFVLINPFRVHGSDGANGVIEDAFDFSSAFTGTYADSEGRSANIDGVDETLSGATPTWAFTTSTSEGSISAIYKVDFDAAGTTTSYSSSFFYDDNPAAQGGGNNPLADGDEDGLRGAFGITSISNGCFDPSYEANGSTGDDCIALNPNNPPTLIKTSEYHPLPSSATSTTAANLRGFFDAPLVLSDEDISMSIAEGTIEINFPTNGSSFTVGSSIDVEATMFDSDGIRNSRVLVSYNSSTNNTQGCSQANYNQPYPNTVFSETFIACEDLDIADADLFDMQAGTYDIQVTYVDDLNNQVSDIVSITISANATPSNVTTYNGIALQEGDNLQISVDATDSDGAVQRVEFYQDNVLVFTKFSSPYEYTDNSLTVGSYDFYTIVYDDLGATTQSTTQTVTVSSSTTNNRQGAGHQVTLQLLYDMEINPNKIPKVNSSGTDFIFVEESELGKQEESEVFTVANADGFEGISNYKTVSISNGIITVYNNTVTTSYEIRIDPSNHNIGDKITIIPFMNGGRLEEVANGSDVFVTVLGGTILYQNTNNNLINSSPTYYSNISSSVIILQKTANTEFTLISGGL